MNLRCVVVGGGVVGVVTALRLAERGAHVPLVDADVPGSGTSGTTFAHVNASYAGYWDYFELRAAGVAGYRRLRAEFGSAPWLVDTGFLLLESSPGSVPHEVAALPHSPGRSGERRRPRAMALCNSSTKPCRAAPLLIALH